MNKSLQKPNLKVASQAQIEAGPLLESLLRAKSDSRDCIDSASLKGTVDAMAEAVLGLGGRSLYGASEIGHSLAGAIAYRSSGLALWDPASGEPVVLIDGIIAGTAGLSVAAERARALGTKRVEALVVGLIGTHDLADSGIDRLRSLRATSTMAA